MDDSTLLQSGKNWKSTKLESDQRTMNIERTILLHRHTQEAGDIAFSQIRTKDHLVHILIKSLPNPRFADIRKLIRIIDAHKI